MTLMRHETIAFVGDVVMCRSFGSHHRFTQADLFVDNFFGYLIGSCDKRGVDSMTEPYEGPFDPVRCSGRTARPMGEFWATGDRMHTIRCWGWSPCAWQTKAASK